jgi:hypothetical protein
LRPAGRAKTITEKTIISWSEIQALREVPSWVREIFPAFGILNIGIPN